MKIERKRYAQYRPKDFDMVSRKWTSLAPVRVRVLAVAEGYAMVRRPNCVPFVVPEKDLIEAKP